jgi:hypothetical protein
MSRPMIDHDDRRRERAEKLERRRKRHDKIARRSVETGTRAFR